MSGKVILNTLSLLISRISGLLFFSLGGYCIFIMNWSGGLWMNILIAVILLAIFTASVFVLHLSDLVRKKI
ncbi:MAG: hypothetical protein FT714_11920 [Pantoea sp. Pent]|nr:hypothetical protein [Pantoea sp. Pent]